MDKNKIFQTATRLAQKGNLDKAIAEYGRLVKADPNEVRALLKIGELYQKKGANEEASDALEKAAESYAKQGFFLKAVAVYKQVLKLAPTVEAHQRLADLYQQLGLLRDAMAQLQLVIATYEREGKTQETTAILRKMLDLDPENALGRARLGELLLASGEKKEGHAELDRALAQLEKEGRNDDFLRVATRLLQGEAPDAGLARKVAKIYLDKGEARRALAKLQVAFKADGSSAETLELLARGFQAIGDKKKTASVYKELARVHREAKRVKEEREAWKQVLRLAPEDAAARKALQAAAPKTPATPPPLRAAARESAEAIPVPDARGVPQKSESSPTPMPGTSGPRQVSTQAKAATAPAKPEDAGRLLAELDVYLKYKLYPKAQDHLQSLLALDPGALEVQERAARVAEGTGDREAMRAALRKVVELARQAKEEARAEQALARLRAAFPDDPEVEALGSPPESASVSGMIVVDEAAGGDEEVVMAVSLEDEPLDAQAPAEPPPVEEVSAFPLIEEDSALQAALELSSLEPSEAEEVIDEPLLAFDEPAQAPPPAEARSAEAKPAAPEPAEARGAPAPAQPPPDPAPSKPEAAPDPALAADLAEAEFYLQQEMFEEAEELLRAILSQAPGNPKATALLARLGDAKVEAAPPAPQVPEAAPPPPARAVQEGAPAPRPPPPAFAKALTVVPEEEGSFDLAEELLADMNLEETQLPQAADFQYSVEEVLEEFKKGVSQTVRPEDSETHYNLGIAYKEMGLFAEAIGAFQQAMAGCKGTQRELECMITAGLCRVELGDHQRAIELFQAGLGAAALTAEAALALHYEIGSAYEALGEKEKAIEFFSKVHRSAPDYRQVAATLKRLESGGENPTSASPMNKGKVGYV